MRRAPAFLLAAFLAFPILPKRTSLTPGFNIFTPAQDIEVGRTILKEMEAQVELLPDSLAVNYVDALGKRLASNAPGGAQYPFQFKIVNDKSINASGMPGGFVYVNRGTIEAAANEAELAGVIAHEIAHIVLRHVTHQVSNAYALQAPLSTLSSVKRMSVAAVLAKIEGGFTLNSVLLRSSKGNEGEADLMATQILHDAGYDARAVAQFLKTLEAVTKIDKTKKVFSNHPSPSNRISKVNKEIEKLGGTPPNARLDSPEYQDIKRLVSNSPR